MVAPIETKLTWVIFGSEGQLGRQLSVELTERRVPHKCIPRGVADVRNFDEIQSALIDGARVIVNCAAWTDVRGAESNKTSAFEINEVGAGNLALAASELGSIFLHISTDYVFPGDKNTPYTEEDMTYPLNVYGESKLAGERKVLDVYKTKSLIVRTSWLYSPWRKNFVKTMIQKALKSSITEVVNDQTGSPTSAKDLAGKLVMMIEKKFEPGLYNCSGTGETSWFDFAAAIYRLTGKPDSLLVPISSELLKNDLLRPKYTVLDNSKFEQKSSQPMPHWESSLKRDFAVIMKEVEKEADDSRS